MTSSSVQVDAFALLGILFLVFIIIILIFAIPAVVLWWKIFKKAGKPGWASIVPVYSSMVMAEIGDKPVWMGVLAGMLGFGGAALPSSLQYLRSVGSLAGFILSIVLIMGVAKKFDKSTGFWVAVILLPIVAVFMVDNANYIGDGVIASGGPASNPSVQ